MAEEKKETAPATPAETPAMSQGKPSDVKTETKAYTSVEPSSAGRTPPPASDWTSMLPMIGSMILVFYFLMIRPEKKRREQQLAMMSAIKKGDKVVLAAVGIYGTISDLDGDDATLIIDTKKDVRIKVRKDAISLIPDEKEKK